MAQQTFRSVFRADIGQYRGQMQALRQSTTSVIGEVRNNLVALAGISFAGMGIKELVSNIISLGAEMQQTRTAFAVMLDGAERANQVIGELNHFADITPFDNDEVIRSGRLLLNAGVSAEKLTEKLTTLGDIAAGAQVPLEDMVGIYAQAANKGRVQAMELNRLAQRGVPILQALASTLGRTTQEVLKLGEEGRLSFGLLDEALASMSAEGGRYFGLMEQQSANLGGRWSVVMATMRNAARDVGEESIPALSAALEDFAAALEDLRESGELDAIISDMAKSLGEIASSLKDILVYLVQHQKQIKAIAGGALWIGIAVKARGIVLALAKSLQGLAAAQTAQTAAAAGSAVATGTAATATAVAGTAAAGASVKVGLLAKALSAVGVAAGVAGAILATAFIAWKVGEVLRELLGLEQVFTRMMLRAQGLSPGQIGDLSGEDKVEASAPKLDLAKAEAEKRDLEARLQRLSQLELPKESQVELAVGTDTLETELQALNRQLNAAQEGSDKRLEDLAATDAKIKALLDERERLEQRLAGRATAAEKEKLTAEIAEIDATTGDYHQQMEAEAAALEETKAKMKKLNADLIAAKREQAKAVSATTPGAKGRIQKAYQTEIIDPLADQLEKLRQLSMQQRQAVQEYNEAQEELADWKTGEGLAKAEELSAADKFRAEERKRLAEEVDGHLAKLTRDETELKKAEWAKQVDAWRDAYRQAGMDTEVDRRKLQDLEEAGYAEIAKERRKRQQSMHDHLARLTLSETDQKRRELAKQLEAYRQAGATQRQLARLQAAGLADIERDKVRKIIAANRQLDAARRRQGEEVANRKLETLLQRLDRAGEALREKLGRFDFVQDAEWRQLAKDPAARRARKKESALDESIAEKMDALARGERVRFTARERKRIEERERLERQLAANEARGQKAQQDAARRQHGERRQELAKEVREAQRKLAEAQGQRPGGRQLAPQAPPAAPRAPKPAAPGAPKPESPEAPPRKLRVEGAPQIAAAPGMAATIDYRGQLTEITRQLGRLGERVFVVKGA